MTIITTIRKYFSLLLLAMLAVSGNVRAIAAIMTPEPHPSR